MLAVGVGADEGRGLLRVSKSARLNDRMRRISRKSIWPRGAGAIPYLHQPHTDEKTIPST